MTGLLQVAGYPQASSQGQGIPPFAGNILPPIAHIHRMGAQGSTPSTHWQPAMAHRQQAAAFQPGLHWLSALPTHHAAPSLQHGGPLAPAPFPAMNALPRVELRQGELGLPGFGGAHWFQTTAVQAPFPQAPYAQGLQVATSEQLLQVLGAMNAQADVLQANNQLWAQAALGQAHAVAARTPPDAMQANPAALGQAHAVAAHPLWAQAIGQGQQAKKPPGGGGDNGVVVTVMGRRKLRKNEQGEIEEHKRDDLSITKEDLKALYGLQLRIAADRLGISHTAFKTACRKAGITKWPYRKLQGLKNLGIDMADVSDELLSMSLESAKAKLAHAAGATHRKRSLRRGSSGSPGGGPRNHSEVSAASSTDARTESEHSSVGGLPAAWEEEDM